MSTILFFIGACALIGFFVTLVFSNTKDAGKAVLYTIIPALLVMGGIGLLWETFG